ncbi:unnamed protein product [Lampetra planeri]
MDLAQVSEPPSATLQATGAIPRSAESLLPCCSSPSILTIEGDSRSSHAFSSSSQSSTASRVLARSTSTAAVARAEPAAPPARAGREASHAASRRNDALREIVCVPADGHVIFAHGSRCGHGGKETTVTTVNPGGLDEDEFKENLMHLPVNGQLGVDVIAPSVRGSSAGSPQRSHALDDQREACKDTDWDAASYCTDDSIVVSRHVAGEKQAARTIIGQRRAPAGGARRKVRVRLLDSFASAPAAVSDAAAQGRQQHQEAAAITAASAAAATAAALAAAAPVLKAQSDLEVKVAGVTELVSGLARELARARERDVGPDLIRRRPEEDEQQQQQQQQRVLRLQEQLQEQLVQRISGLERQHQQHVELQTRLLGRALAPPAVPESAPYWPVANSGPPSGHAGPLAKRVGAPLTSGTPAENADLCSRAPPSGPVGPTRPTRPPVGGARAPRDEAGPALADDDDPSASGDRAAAGPARPPAARAGGGGDSGARGGMGGVLDTPAPRPWAPVPIPRDKRRPRTQPGGRPQPAPKAGNGKFLREDTLSKQEGHRGSTAPPLRSVAEVPAVTPSWTARPSLRGTCLDVATHDEPLPRPRCGVAGWSQAGRIRSLLSP